MDYFLCMKKTDLPDIDFTRLLTQGASTYDSSVGEWWQNRSLDEAHRRAYRHIVNCTARQLQEMGLPSPECVVDYACGAGPLLMPLRRAFPHATLVGLDGSHSLLEQALQKSKGPAALVEPGRIFTRAEPPLRLARCVLPDFGMPRGGADLLVFAFPNLLPDENHLHQFNRNGYSDRNDNEVARMLARFREMDPDDEVPVSAPDDLFDELMTQRVFARHLRHLMKPGALLVRVEYTQVDRAQLTDLTRWRMLFAEGALDRAIKGKKVEALFRYLGSEYRRSSVIQDVYHQTGNPDDARGGYMVGFFQAL